MMKPKRKLSAKKHSSVHWGGVAFTIFFIFLLSSFCFLLLQYKRNALNSPFFSAYFARMELWVAARKDHLQKGLANETVAKKKTISPQKNDAPKPLHFEFYTALPNMQVTPSQPALEAKQAEIKVVADKKIAASQPKAIVSREELEKELSDHFKQTYIVQLGVFRTSAAAYRYHQTAIQSGFNASIVKLRAAEKEIYRVQMGPFFNKVDAKGAQQKLQKQGMDSIVLKMDAA